MIWCAHLTFDLKRLAYVKNTTGHNGMMGMCGEAQHIHGFPVIVKVPMCYRWHGISSFEKNIGGFKNFLLPPQATNWVCHCVLQPSKGYWMVLSL